MDDQATAGFRIGQRRRVQAREFVGTGAGTLEKRIDQLIEGVEVLANMVVGDGESWPTELSTTQLGELFALPKEAIGEGASRLALLSGIGAYGTAEWARIEERLAAVSYLLAPLDAGPAREGDDASAAVPLTEPLEVIHLSVHGPTPRRSVARGNPSGS